MIRPIRQRLCFDVSSDSKVMRDPEIDAIDAAMRQRGHSRADLGRLLGLDSAQVSRIFSGRRRLQLHEAKRVHQWLGTPDAVADAGGAVIPMPGMVPLYGWSADDHLAMNDQAIRGYVPQHPRQAQIRDAFALEISDISMSPRYEPGEIVYVAPNRWPARQQDCLVVTKGGVGLLRRFVKRDETRIILEQLNPHKESSVTIEEMNYISSIVGRD